VRVIDPESMQALPVNRKGLVLVKGPNRMIGYIGQPEQTSRVMLDGWYITGDIGVIDEDGFLRIAGRAPTRNPAACIGSSTGLSGDNSCA
jgi:acyl-[acyl-carrier-protein]-phospholipid O-acyltransferase/long-chain-fatty-acid--[acyl-carrier-protein] ligase